MFEPVERKRSTQNAEHHQGDNRLAPKIPLSPQGWSDNTKPCQVVIDLSSCLVAFANIILARLKDNGVQLKKRLPLSHAIEVGRQIRIVESIRAGAGFVKHHAQAIEIGLRFAGTFRRDVSLRA